MKRPFRWGIVGPGNIARNFATAIQGMDDACVTAVASRSAERAQAFLDNFGKGRAYVGCNELATDPDVDAVYVATPHPMHEETAICLLSAGKPVLCEKPLAVNSSQVRRIVEAARANNVFMMEAVWTRFLPVMQQVREWIKDGRIGDVLRLVCDFSFRCNWNPEGRLLNPALAGGGLLDVGIYTISMADWVFGCRPARISSLAHIGASGVDEQAGMLFLYPDGAMAMLSCGVRVQGKAAACITGTDGEIDIPTSFYKAEHALLTTKEAEEGIDIPHKINGYEYEAAEVARCVRAGLLESPDMTHQQSLDCMAVMDSLRKEWGVRYPFE